MNLPVHHWQVYFENKQARESFRGWCWTTLMLSVLKMHTEGCKRSATQSWKGEKTSLLTLCLMTHFSQRWGGWSTGVSILAGWWDDCWLRVPVVWFCTGASAVYSLCSTNWKISPQSSYFAWPQIGGDLTSWSLYGKNFTIRQQIKEFPSLHLP